MSARLEDLITSARELDGSWDGDRALRVREGALHRRDGQVRRDRVLRRGLVVAGGAGLLLLVLLRAASSAPAEPATATVTAAAPVIAPAAPMSEALAARMLGDAGYARD